MTIDVQMYEQMVADSTPGRYEGETAATAYFYEAYLNGDGEGLDDYSLFSVSDEEREAFGLDFNVAIDGRAVPAAFLGLYFLVRQDDNGFIYGHSATVEMVAELRAEIEAIADEEEEN